MTKRIHIVDEETQIDGEVRRALCGRYVLSREELACSHLCVQPKDLMPHLAAIAKIVTPSEWGERNWVAVDEFIYDGDDSPNCVPCRRKLDAAIEAHFEDSDEGGID